MANRIRAAVIGIAIVLAEGGGLVAHRLGAGDWLDVRLGRKSKLDLIVSAEYQPLVSHPKFREVTKDKSPAEVRALAATLTSRGLQYLELPDLQDWARIKMDMAERSPKLCAGMWTRSPEASPGAPALAELAEPDVRAWARLSARASLRALEGASPPTTDPEAYRRALESIVAKIPEADRPSVIADLAKREELSEGRACELMRLVLGGARDLPADLQREFLRALTRT